MRLCVVVLPLAAYLSVVTVATENNAPTRTIEDAEEYSKNGNLAEGKILLESISFAENLSVQVKSESPQQLIT